MGNQQVNGTGGGGTGTGAPSSSSSRRSGGALFTDGGGAQAGASSAMQHPHHPQYQHQQHQQQQHQQQQQGGVGMKPPPGGSAPMGYMQSHAAQYPGMAQQQQGAGVGGGGSMMMRDHSMQDMMSSSDRTTGGAGQYNSSSSNSNNNNSMMGSPPHPSSSSSSVVPLDLAALSAAEEDSVPTVFRWEHGGRNVYITGTFNGWSRQIPMHRSGNDFTYIHNLKRGKHAFKFIVDDEWRFAPDQPTVADIEGRINNFIDVTDFKPYTGDTEFESERHYAVHCSRAAAAEALKNKKKNANNNGGSDSGGGGAVGSATASGSDHDDTSSKGSRKGTDSSTMVDPDGEVYGHSMPDLDEYTKEPPPLPPHLRHIILNKPPQLTDTAALPVPQHVALNHLYCTAIKDNMMVLGITQRYKMKSCTTVYYSPC
ncbi:hypothetical protein ACHAWU_009777 [Discostella pseudostelligera]|uniref:Association with the SNF1 complex (ASC) domain-containing protein n=1 Tax=Discostella pseudostelligera TaxID=259834 RepID=A0ABD3MGF7_9STRA